MILDNKNLDMTTIFDSKNYHNLTLNKKEDFIVDLFHSINWDRIKPTDRINLLKEFERVKAIIDDRKSYKVKLIKDMRAQLQVRRLGRSLYVKKDFIENGIGSIIEDKKICRGEMPYLNIEALEGILHEQYHINTFKNAFKFNQYTKEMKQYLVWAYTNRYVFSQKKIYSYIDEGKGYYYRFIPEEYYAFKYSVMQTLEYFERLQEKFGDEKYMKDYLIIKKVSELIIANQFNEATNGNFTYDEAFMYAVDKAIKTYCTRLNIDEEEYRKELDSTKTYIKKKIN